MGEVVENSQLATGEKDNNILTGAYAIISSIDYINKAKNPDYVRSCQDLKLEKSENETLEKPNNSLSVANKSLKKDLRDTQKKKDEEIKKLTCKLKELVEFKAREAKKQEKKLSKKRKKEAEIYAVAELKRLCKIKQEELSTNLPINEEFDLVDACDSTTAES